MAATDCGVGTFAGFGAIHPPICFAKLASMAEVAEYRGSAFSSRAAVPGVHAVFIGPNDLALTPEDEDRHAGGGGATLPPSALASSWCPRWRCRGRS